MNLTPKETLKLFNRKQVTLFPRSTRKKLTIYPTSRFPRRLFAWKALTLHKKEPAFLGVHDHGEEDGSPQHNIDFIVHDEHRTNKPPKSDEEIKKRHADSFVWHTSKENVREALFHGIMRPDSLGLTAKVINELGKYRLIALGRIYEKGIISNKYQQKDAFLRITQERIEALQGLERMVNNYNVHATVDENYNRFCDELDVYITSLEAIKKNASHNEHICGFENQAVGYLYQNINYDIKKARDFQSLLAERKAKGRLTERYLRNYTFAATGVSSTLEFIKERMICSIRSMQAHNEVMTRARSAMALFVGDINSVAEDAMKIINDHQPDLHNLTLHAHQGIFVSKQRNKKNKAHDFDEGEEDAFPSDDQDDPKNNEEKLITVDFSHLEKSVKDIDHALMAISIIEKDDEIVREKNVNDNIQYKLKTGDKEQNLKTTRFTKWAINKNAKFVALRTLAWFWNILSGIIAGLLFDFVVGFVGGCLNIKPFCLAEWLRWTPVNPDDIETGFHKLEHEIKMPNQSLGTKFGKLIGNFFRNTVLEFIQGARIVFHGYTFELIDSLKSDWKIGHNGIPNENIIKDKVLEKLAALKEKKKEQMEDIEKQINDFIPEDEKSLTEKENIACKITKEEVNTLIANAPYELSPGEFKDLLNSTLNGVNIFCDAFIHDIGAKHPFTWEVFIAAYIFGGFAVLAPSQMAFMGQSYLAFSNTLGATVGKSTISKAISSALYQAELSTIALDTIFNGNAGMLAGGLMALESDPSNIIMYTGAAFLLGWLIAFQFHIPWLSVEIQNDLGTVPPAALTVAGAKIGILLYELLETEEINVQDIPKSLDRRERYKLLIKHQHPTSSDKELNELMDKILDDELEETLFYIQLEKNKELLPYLDHATKRELLELMTNKYRGNPEMRNAMVNLLFPKNTQSILVVTLTTIFSYIPMILRCLLTVVTWTKEPWMQLWDSLKKDLTRIMFALTKIVKAAAYFCNVTLGGFCNVFLYKIIGRVEGLIRNKDQVVAHAGHTISARFDCSWHRMKEVLGAPTDFMRKHCTTPDGSKIAQHEIGEVAYKFFGKGSNQEQEQEKVLDDDLEMVETTVPDFEI